jgi:hypothetical protein
MELATSTDSVIRRHQCLRSRHNPKPTSSNSFRFGVACVEEESKESRESSSLRVTCADLSAEWELPIVVRERPSAEAAAARNPMIVFVEKPLLKRYAFTHISGFACASQPLH